jgi:hypothetical protein
MTLVFFRAWLRLLIIVPRAYLPLLEFLWLLVAVLVAVHLFSLILLTPVIEGRSRFSSVVAIVHPVRVVDVSPISWTALVPIISEMLVIWLKVVVCAIAHALPIFVAVSFPVTMNHSNEFVWHIPIKEPGPQI